MRHTFQAEQWVPYPPEQVFAFFADPHNLPLLMPPWQRARIDTMHLEVPPVPHTPAAVVAGQGSRIVISFRPVPLLPVRLVWEATIVAFAWNEFFCDEQGKGPFRYFRHCHRIREAEREGTPGTLITDDVTYELPLGVLGDLANAGVVAKQIRALFAHRQRTLPKLMAHPKL